MSPRKLSDSDKREILSLYRQPDETTSTLAIRYSVSSSTISRLLKSRLAEEEYEGLIQQKRSTRTPGGSPVQEDQITLEPEPELVSEAASEESEINPERRVRKRIPTTFKSVVEIPPPTPRLSVTEVPASTHNLMQEGLDDSYSASNRVFSEMLGEELIDLDDEDTDLEDADEDDWEDDDIGSEHQTSAHPLINTNRANVQVLPLSEASIPKTCYLVVDRAAELIARPLKEFSDLGRIPVDEVQQKTLPIFDNHRVARRFSNRAQRVIKIPDGRMLQKTCTQLKAKGITRLLIDGQVYSLS